LKVFIDAPLLIYLNTLSDLHNRIPYEDFYIDILNRYTPYTDVLVLDELMCISKKKYRVPYDVSIEFIDSSVLPYVNLLRLGEEEYLNAVKILEKYNIKPSDSIHLGAMAANNLSLIVSEDREYDKIPLIKRLWDERLLVSNKI
jgi:predicted nucleic acid-binding protein